MGLQMHWSAPAYTYADQGIYFPQTRAAYNFDCKIATELVVLNFWGCVYYHCNIQQRFVKYYSDAQAVIWLCWTNMT